MQLSKNERVIRQWDYASAQGQSSTKTQATLAVTNKRIIHNVQNQSEIERSELYLKDVKSVEAKHISLNGMRRATWLLILGILFTFVGAIGLGVTFTERHPDEAPIIIFGIFIGLGVLFLYIRGILWLLRKNMQSFSCLQLYIYTYGNSELALGIGAAAGKRPGKAMGRPIQITVNNTVARDIVESLTAIILDAKEASLTSEEE